MSSLVTKSDIIKGLRVLGVENEMVIEVHSSLHSFGHVAGGAYTLIEALMEVIGNSGAIVMPSFLLSHNLSLSDIDKKLGLTCKIKILEEDVLKTGMGIVSDTFRTLPDVITGQGRFRVSAWGKDTDIHSQGFQHLIDMDGWALLLGVDIYKLSSMHYVEDILPIEIREYFKASKEAQVLYPGNQWVVEGWNPPVKAWYTIQDLAYENGFIREGMIGDCKCMFLKVRAVIGLYRQALQNNPFGLYGLR